VRLREVRITEDGRMRERDAPTSVPADAVLVLQPYGSLFFASAPNLERLLPDVSHAHRSIILLRLRGTDQLGLAFIAVLRRYLHALEAVGGSMKIVASEPLVLKQLAASGLAAELGEGNVYRGREWVGEALRQAHDDARAQLAESKGD
jgi:SulP family sulfate permease